MSRNIEVLSRELLAGIAVAVAGALMVAPAADAQEYGEVLNDPEIRQAVRDELVLDPVINVDDMAVRVDGGNITLVGTVNSLEAKARAEGIAQSVKGVFRVNNELRVVSPWPLEDMALENDVRAALLEDPVADAYQIDAIVNDGVVTLNGTVDTMRERQQALEAVESVRGVLEIQNQIDVEPAEERSDAEIRQDVVQSLRFDSLVDDALITVSVEDGRVILTGSVGSAAEREEAIEDSWLPGVVNVDASALKVEKWARDDSFQEGKYVERDDASIRLAVQNTLEVEPRIEADEVSVNVNAGAVTLNGTVRDLQAKQTASRIVNLIVGVESVNNQLNVRTETIRSDDELQMAVESALARDPFVEDFEISVDVSGSVVNLYGKVEAFFEKAQAEDVVSRIDGVTAIDNQISVENIDVATTYNPYVDQWDINSYEWYDYRPDVSAASDAELKQAVQRQLYWSPYVNEREVAVAVEDGTVTLSGRVNTYAEARAAIENAYQAGAIDVLNSLEIG